MDRWDVLAVGHGHDSEVLAVHAALLGDGRVLYFSGSEHNPQEHAEGLIDHSRIWDPVGNEVHHIPSPAHDLFCCGHAFLTDGRLLVAGGTKTYDYTGVRDITVFDPDQDHHHHVSPWIPGPEMRGGRWYPTLVTLPDGRVVIVSGTLDQPVPAPVNPDIEVFTADGHDMAVEVVGEEPFIPGGYPRMHLLPNGQVFCVGQIQGVSRMWNPISFAWTDVAPGPGIEFDSTLSTSVLLPLQPADGYRARVMGLGVAQPLIMDFGAAEQVWQPAPPRALPGSPIRNFACAVLLPDATVLVVGGSTTTLDADGVQEAEAYDPATGTWEVRAKASVPRVYHSVALLLPDGRVWTSGSNHDGLQGHAELRVEVYSPPYLFKGPRPLITAAPASVRVSTGLPATGTFAIATPQSGAIVSVALMRCGSITHAFDADQRYVGLPILARSPGAVTVGLPPTTAIAPPGPYHLFVVDGDGVPSVGRPIRVEPVTWGPPHPVPGWFGGETAGAGLAAADLSGTGKPDLVVLHVDNPAGENHGYYRIGWDVESTGHVAGGWTEPMLVPGWFGGETAGAGVAAADISGSGRPDLVVFHVDNPEGDNHGYYRIGWNVGAAGHVAGGWTEPMLVPGWFGGSTAGAGIAVADISGSSRPDLVVFHIDSPEGANHGYYRIGWDVDAAGVVTGGWSQPVHIPGWFGGVTAGGDIAIADLTGNGRPDLVVFHIDSPEGGNRGFCRVGWNVDPNGHVAGGWTEPIPVPGWFGAESAGAGVAAADLSGNGRADVVVLHVDNPDGENRAYWRVFAR